MEEIVNIYKKLTVASFLPSGLEGFSVRIFLEENALELTVTCPTPIGNLKQMHKKLLQANTLHYEVYHPEYARFAEALKPLRKSLVIE